MNKEDTKKLLAHSIFEHILFAQYYLAVTEGRNCTIDELLDDTRKKCHNIQFMLMSFSSIIGQLQFIFCFCKDIISSTIENEGKTFAHLQLSFDIPVLIWKSNTLVEKQLSNIPINKGLRHIRNAISHPKKRMIFVESPARLKLIDINENNRQVFEMEITLSDAQELLQKLQIYWLSS